MPTAPPTIPNFYHAVQQTPSPVGAIRSSPTFEQHEGTAKSGLKLVQSSGSVKVSPLRLAAKAKTPAAKAEVPHVVTRESTILLKDIYNDIQTALKKYDDIIKEYQLNKLRNNSIKSSGVKSMAASSAKKCNFTCVWCAIFPVAPTKLQELEAMETSRSRFFRPQEKAAQTEEVNALDTQLRSLKE